MATTRRFNIRQVGFALAIHILILSTASAQIAFNVPSQPLAQALKALAVQADLDIYFDPPTVEGLQAPALEANLTVGQALRRLLSGTHLHAVRVDKHTVRIVADPHSPGAPRPSRTSGTDFSAPKRNKSDPPSAPSESPPNGSNSPLHSDTGHHQRIADLEEIVITAEKRPETLLNAPLSVSVLSSSYLHTLGAFRLQDFAATVPGLTLTTDGAGFSQLTIRGVTTGNLPVSPTVAVYLDDVPIGSSSAFGFGGRLGLDVGLFDIRRIEVLRGPQGTLYGANTMGGLLRYVTNEPNLQHLDGTAQFDASGTQHGGPNADLSATINIPLAPDVLALRATAYESHDGGFIDNVALDQNDVNSSDLYGGRLDLLAAPTQALTVRIGTVFQDIYRNGQQTVDYTFSGSPAFGDLNQSRQLAEPFSQKFRLVSARFSYDAGPVDLTSISAYQTFHTIQQYDYSRLYVPLLSSIGLPFSAVGLTDAPRTDKFTQEIRISSHAGGLIQWLVGGFYTHETSGDDEAFVLRDTSGQPAPNNLFNYAAPSLYEEYAGFADLTYHPFSKLALTGGVRYSSDHQVFSQFSSGLFGNVSISAASTEHKPTYLADAAYHIDATQTVYFRYATGYRPGGPNFVAYDPSTGLPLAPSTFRPDSLNSYEMGFKADALAHRLSIDADAYYIRWNNVQIATARGGFGVFLNAPAGATIRGAELSISARPVPGLLLNVASAYQDPRMSGTDPDLGAADGERLPNVPPLTASAGADYYFSDGKLSPTIGATVNYTGARNASFNGSAVFPQYPLPSYTTLDLRAGLTIKSTSLQLYVHNLRNTRGLLSADTDRGPLAQVAVIQPRTIGFSVSTKF